MALEYVDRLFAEIDAPQPVGKVELLDVVSIDVEEDQPLQTVKTMTRNRKARGFRAGTIDVTAELTLAMPLAPTVDWHYLRRYGIVFDLKYEAGDGGQRFQLIDCRVQNISKSSNEDGEAELKVSLMALDHAAVPGTGGLLG